MWAEHEINDTATSISFLGSQATGYGQPIAENYLHILINFASVQTTQNPVEGQTSYDPTAATEQLLVHDGTNWVSAGGINKGKSDTHIALSLTHDITR